MGLTLRKVLIELHCKLSVTSRGNCMTKIPTLLLIMWKLKNIIIMLKAYSSFSETFNDTVFQIDIFKCICLNLSLFNNKGVGNSQCEWGGPTSPTSFFKNCYNLSISIKFLCYLKSVKHFINETFHTRFYTAKTKY